MTKPSDYEDVQAARESLHEAGASLVAQVLGHFAASKHLDASLERERVLAELNGQQALVAEARSGHRPVLDVDPEAEVDPDDAVISPTGGPTRMPGDDDDSDDPTPA